MRRLGLHTALTFSVLMLLATCVNFCDRSVGRSKPYHSIYVPNRIETLEKFLSDAKRTFAALLGRRDPSRAALADTLPSIEDKARIELRSRNRDPNKDGTIYQTRDQLFDLSGTAMAPIHSLNTYVSLTRDRLARWSYYRWNGCLHTSFDHDSDPGAVLVRLYCNALGKQMPGWESYEESVTALDALVFEDEGFHVDSVQEALALARRAKTETEGWLPGEGIIGVSLYRKIRPRAILDRIGLEEHFWVVRFGRHHEGDPDRFYRTTQEYWIDARSGLTRAIFPPLPGPYKESNFKDAITPGYSLDVFRALGSDITRAAACDIRTLLGLRGLTGLPAGPIIAAAACDIRTLLGLREFRIAPHSVSLKPFACSDYLWFVADEDFVNIVQYRNYDPGEREEEKDYHDRDLASRVAKLPPSARALLAELGQCRISSPLLLTMIIATDTLISEHQGILLRWMTQGAATVYLIRMGRDVEGFAQEGDLVYVAHQAYGPFPYNRGFGVYYAPLHCRTIWVNARTGAFFSVVAADPHDRVERIVLPAKSQSPWEIYINKIPRCPIELD